MGVVQITQPTTQTTLASSVIQQTPERQGKARKEEQVIMQILVLCLAISAHAVPQGINFGESASTTKKPAVGLDPTASQNQGTSSAFPGPRAAAEKQQPSVTSSVGQDHTIVLPLVWLMEKLVLESSHGLVSCSTRIMTSSGAAPSSPTTSATTTTGAPGKWSLLPTS